MSEHCHFYCDECGTVQDVEFSETLLLAHLNLPRGCRTNRLNLAIHGICPACATAKRKR